MPPCGSSPSAVGNSSFLRIGREEFSSATLTPQCVTVPSFDDEFKTPKKGSENQQQIAAEAGIEAALVAELEKYEPQSKWYHASFHVVCAMVGTGVLGLPKVKRPMLALCTNKLLAYWQISVLVGRISGSESESERRSNTSELQRYIYTAGS